MVHFCLGGRIWNPRFVYLFSEPAVGEKVEENNAERTTNRNWKRTGINETRRENSEFLIRSRKLCSLDPLGEFGVSAAVKTNDGIRRKTNEKLRNRRWEAVPWTE
ncbi:hypothetical protein L596_028063 [Steinernema carpocapsae]|uniref:Uncharacterized protein n=1 Tax=Steinernema carpocapsae TaxID=34508 RepID=A0A4U5LXC2_STECR|nr:hypothetical protein L596_028063 [Steinernema carpocapsae]